VKVIAKEQLNHVQLLSSKTNEYYSFSELVSKLLGSKQLFIHHNILKPGSRSSEPHRHTLIEEVVYIVKGNATVVEDQKEITINEGAFILFDPKEKGIHYLANRTNQNIETLTFSVNMEFDTTIFEGHSEDEPLWPPFHFDQNLRETPDDIEQWKVFVQNLVTQLKNENHLINIPRQAI
jgi:uncharacterized cupin superfamily protein